MDNKEFLEYIGDLTAKLTERRELTLNQSLLLRGILNGISDSIDLQLSTGEFKGD